MLGSTEDPEPESAKAVAGSIFAAVAVYAVCRLLEPSLSFVVLLLREARLVLGCRANDNGASAGLPGILRISGIFACAG